MLTDDISISAWVKMGSSQKSYPTIVSKGGTSSRNEGYWFYFSGTRIKFAFSDGTQRLSNYSSNVDVMDNTWHHVAVSVDRDGDLNFYLDGENVGTKDVSSFSGKNVSNSSVKLTLGSADQYLLLS